MPVLSLQGTTGVWRLIDYFLVGWFVQICPHSSRTLSVNNPGSCYNMDLTSGQSDRLIGQSVHTRVQ
ncbi:hypothetical protein BaRGS_00029236, partial [Batillaria attramentaria]